MNALAEKGVQIALDDFGTGYASLANLNKFRVHIIKIDRLFIARLETSNHDAAIVRAVVKLGRSLGIQIVAEGIETSDRCKTWRSCAANRARDICSARPPLPRSCPQYCWLGQDPRGSLSAGAS